MKLTAWGAAKQVTGSMHMLELDDGYKILIDCGLDFEREPILHSYDIFPFEPSEINLVILTHAHLDHSGNLPNLFRYGYEGQVLCTTPTADLVELLLKNSASLHTKIKKQAKKEAEKEFRKTGEYIQQMHWELFSEDDVIETVDRFVPIATESPFQINKNLRVTFYPVGHLLGACSIYFDIKTNEGQKTVLLSGDVGRFDFPLYQPPTVPPAADVVICESTYGNKHYEDREEMDFEGMLENVIDQACYQNAGRLLLPAFSVGKTQLLLHLLKKIKDKGKLEGIKVLMDSPLSINATAIFKKHVRQLSEEVKELYRDDEDDVFFFDGLTRIFDAKKARDYYEQSPIIILSSAGMMNGGRIVDHLRRNVENSYSTLFVTGWCSPDTLGYQILQRPETITIRGKEMKFNINLIDTDIYGGHGWYEDLIQFMGNQKRDKLQKLLIVHGELEVMEIFKSSLDKEGFANVEIAEKGKSYSI